MGSIFKQWLWHPLVDPTNPAVYSTSCQGTNLSLPTTSLMENKMQVLEAAIRRPE